MTGNGRKQIQSIVDKLESAISNHEKQLGQWNGIGMMPMLGSKVVEDLLNHLRGLDEKKTRKYEWMLKM